MTFICEKTALSDALTNVSKAVADRSAISSLEGVKFSLADSLLELTGYDLEIGIRTTFPVQSADKGSFIVNARFFSEMVRKMPDGAITIEVDENYMITIKNGSVFFTINSVPADDYPELPQKEGFDSIDISQPVLKSMILQTKFAASQLDIKPILKGELFTIEENTLTVAAIDGYRLAVRTEPIAYNENVKFIVPAKNLDEVAKLLSDEPEDICHMFLSKKHIIFEIGRYLVNSRLLEGEFHPYKSSIPVTHNTEIVVERTQLITSLERCLLLINEKNPSPVRCRFENGTLKLKCQTGAIGKVQDEIDVGMTGSSIEIGFKCRFFLDPLKTIPDEKVKLQLSGPLQPMKIVPMEGENYVFLVLPVRLPKE
ncbi:DNA polymerase-3 subunit beta [Ruminococcus sp. YE71]|uniref:DNA polymerase III subunit beta n=1 Tax=unclassified Ruminococcus TaxID=2608920 RepID=UPI000887BB50|nr:MULTISPECIES: DNA polymerase III subunit beta [unclassified Ruminococcus]SDA31571.1 DNA polymerase-3 subunit beta [Ruminococcus sp. YE78]SFW52244.1 DNA polymerase-3 subunit beta [Ruminococcus sp. YE71]